MIPSRRGSPATKKFPICDFHWHGFSFSLFFSSSKHHNSASLGGVFGRLDRDSIGGRQPRQGQQGPGHFAGAFHTSDEFHALFQVPFGSSRSFSCSRTLANTQQACFLLHHARSSESEYVARNQAMGCVVAAGNRARAARSPAAPCDWPGARLAAFGEALLTSSRLAWGRFDKGFGGSGPVEDSVLFREACHICEIRLHRASP